MTGATSDNSTAPQSSAQAGSQPHTPSTVLVLGARGRFGSAAARAFARAGWRVLAQVRPHKTDSNPFSGVAGIECLPLGLDDEAGLVRAAAGVSVVVHAINPLYTNAAWTTDAPALLESVIRVSKSLGATLMFPGNVYNFGEAMGAELSETSEQKADTVKGRARIAMEQRLEQEAKTGGLRVVVIRAGDFFGSGRGTWFDQTLTPKLPLGQFTYFDTLMVPTAWAYLPDLAETFVEMARHAQLLPAFEVLHFQGHTLSGQDWVDALTVVAKEQGWVPAQGRLKVGFMPWLIIRLGGLFNPVWKALPEMRYIWQRPHRLINRKLVQHIGVEPHTPLPVAVRAALADLGLLERQPSAAA